jgi:Na+-transporting NADH:ubiquinone oxidoreductase subunit D
MSVSQKTSALGNDNSLTADLRKGRKALRAGIFLDNPIFCQLLGVCSALAVTNKLANAIVMSCAVILVAMMSNGLVSIMRNFIPRRIRLIVEVVIIAFFVIAFDQVLKAYWFDMSRELGPYVGLIITNCIIMGRAEAFALQNRLVPSLMDGLGNGLGYTLVLCLVAVVRELTGSASLLAGTPLAIVFRSGELPPDVPCLIQIPIDVAPAQIMAMAPGAFFTIAVLIFVFGAFKPPETQ